MSLRGRIYRGAGLLGARHCFRWTGEKRAPKAGEYYLSGAIPEVYRAAKNLEPDGVFHIMEPYTPDPGELIHDGHIYVRKGER